jgi:hypothetical protein
MRLLILALLALLVLTAPASAAPRCPAGSTLFVKKPRACLVKNGKLAGPLALKPMLTVAPKPPTGARRNRKTEKLAQRMLGTVARASRQGDDSFGRQVSSSTAADGTTTTTYKRPDGIETVARAEEHGGVTGPAWRSPAPARCSSATRLGPTAVR